MLKWVTAGKTVNVFLGGRRRFGSSARDMFSQRCKRRRERRIYQIPIGAKAG